MKNIVRFCDKTVNKTTQVIKNIGSSMRRNASQRRYHAIQTEINANKGSARKFYSSASSENITT